jgi:hypothetical protein
MKKLLVGLMLAGSLTMAMPAFATPTTLGSFVSSEIKPGQPHRLYFTITAGHGAKTCDVTLLRKVATAVDLGTDKQGDGMLFFIHGRRTKVALAQAQAAPSPTRRIVCTH